MNFGFAVLLAVALGPMIVQSQSSSIDLDPTTALPQPTDVPGTSLRGPVQLQCFDYSSPKITIGGLFFGNESYSMAPISLTTAGLDNSDYVTAHEFCQNAGYKDCSSLVPVVNDLLYIGATFTSLRNLSMGTITEELYGKDLSSSSSSSVQVPISNLQVNSPYQNISAVQKPVGYTFSSSVSDTQVEVTARIAKSSCKSLPCSESDLTDGAVRVIIGSVGDGVAAVLNGTFYNVAAIWSALSTPMSGPPLGSGTFYFGPIPNMIDLIGIANLTNGVLSDDEFSGSVANPDPILQFYYRVAVLNETDSKTSPLQICGNITDLNKLSDITTSVAPAHSSAPASSSSASATSTDSKKSGATRLMAVGNLPTMLIYIFMLTLCV